MLFRSQLQNDAQAHEVAMAAAGSQHEAAEREAQNVHQVGMASAQAQDADEKAERGHQQGMEAEAYRAQSQGDVAAE